MGKKKWSAPELKVDPFSNDTLTFRISNPSIGYPLIIENIYFGIVSCFGSPFLLDNGNKHVKKISHIELNKVNIEAFNDKDYAYPLTREIFEIQESSSAYFKIVYSVKDFQNKCNQSASMKCDDPGVTNHDVHKAAAIKEKLKGKNLGEGFLFISYVDPTSGTSKKVHTLLYSGSRLLYEEDLNEENDLSRQENNPK